MNEKDEHSDIGEHLLRDIVHLIFSTPVHVVLDLGVT